ncbi:MAG TPA: L,D-transpeptidase [Chloroflexota bacterium]
MLPRRTFLVAAATALASRVTAVQAAPAPAIVISLSAQSLTAYQEGTPVLWTPVTTGRPGLETPVGTTNVFYRSSPYLFISPWPSGSVYWYPPSWVNFALEFRSGGYFVHDAPWEPNWAFGQGSPYGAYASHGCVHVPYNAMRFLYGWTPYGTAVTVTY